MIIDRAKIVSALEAAKEKSVRKMEGKPDKVRKFDEAIDLVLNIRDLDIKNPNNRIEQEHMFPHPVHDDKYKICFFAAGDLEMDIKKQLLLQVKIGKKSQDSKDTMENIDSLLSFLGSKLPNGTNNIKSMYIKTTMGPAIRVEEGSKK